jgi:ATP-dependent DNA helicase MPH1
MSSDGYFEDDLNAATFQELDAIEAAHFPPSKTSSGSRVQPKRPVPPKPLARDSSGLFDLSFDIDESELQRLDDLVNETYHENAPVAGPSNLPRTNLRGMHQTTLFGGVVPAKASSNESASAPRIERQRTKSASRNLFGRQAPKTKQWDRTAFAKSGVKSGKFKGNGKGKGKASFDQDEDEEEEVLEFEQFPAPFVSSESLRVPI